MHILFLYHLACTSGCTKQIYMSTPVIITIYLLISAAYEKPPSKPVKEPESEGTFLFFFPH